MCKEEHRLFHHSLTNTLPGKGQQCVCGWVEKLNNRTVKDTVQLCSSHFTRAFLSRSIKLSSSFSEVISQQSKSNLCIGSLLLQHSMQRTLPVSWCGLGMMDVVGFQPVDLVKSVLPPFLLASLASVIHKSSSFIDASVLHCKSLLSLLGGKALS